MSSRPISVNANGKFYRILTGDLDTSILPASYARGVANGIATLDGSGLIPTGQLPPLAITDVYTVASEAAMLALTAERGDVCVRSDNSTHYILAAEPASVLVNWVFLGAIGGGAVPSVFGRTGAIVATNGDYTASQVTNVPAGGISATNVQAAINELDTEKANLASPTFTGTPAAPTATTGTNTTQIATTEFVNATIAAGGGGEITAALSSGANYPDTVSIATVKAVWWELCLYKGTAVYQTTVQVSHDGSAAYWVQLSPIVVGTVDVTVTCDINTGNMRLVLTAGTTGWAARLRKRTLSV